MNCVPHKKRWFNFYLYANGKGNEVVKDTAIEYTIYNVEKNT